MTVVGRIGAALDVLAQKRKTRMQLAAAIDLQVQLRRFGGGRISLKLRDLILAITHAHVPAGDELQVVVDQLRQTLP
ncbi:hypothetical protein D3C76_1799140 [compost metagenome]